MMIIDEEISYKEYNFLLDNLNDIEWEKDEDRMDHHYYWFMITGEWNKFLTQKFTDYSDMGGVIIGTYDAIDEVLIVDGLFPFKDCCSGEIKDKMIIKLIKLKIKEYEDFERRYVG